MSHYDRAWALYQVNRFKESEVFFHRLIAESPANGYYWEALGHCLKMQNKHEDALEMYRMALFLGCKEPTLFVYIAECLSHTGQKENCLKMLELAERKIDNNKKDSVRLLKKVWS